MQNKIKLNLGCGTTMLDGYVNIDTIENEFIKPNVKADITKTLPYESNSVDEIFASHIIEHFRVWQLKEVLNEWRRILKIGGRLVIECPDLEKAIKNFEKYPNDITMNMWALYGDPHFHEPELEHHWIYSYQTLKPILEEVGFTNFKEDLALMHGKPDRDFRLECVKSNNIISIDSSSIIFTTDDLCPSYLKFFKYWDEVHKKYPGKKLIAFTIANFQNKENIRKSEEFRRWYDEHKDWVEIAVHGYDHLYPPEAERDDFEECIKKALDILKPFLPENYGYRSPGFKFSIRIEPILKKFGFSYIAYRDHIKYFNDERLIAPILNTHCCDEEDWENPITKIWRNI